MALTAKTALIGALALMDPMAFMAVMASMALIVLIALIYVMTNMTRMAWEVGVALCYSEFVNCPIWLVSFKCYNVQTSQT